jgi:formylmethanofuran--tetrahydromethanopterin N-formyltransferase
MIKVNGVDVEDTFAEGFTMYMSRVLVTGMTPRLALAASQEAKGLGVSATLGPGEAGIESKVSSSETPDKRPGYILQFGHSEKKRFNYWFIVRMRKCFLPSPTVSVFDAMPKENAEDFTEIYGTPIQLFGDGYEEMLDIYDRTMYKIPRMGGFFYIEKRFGVARGVAGGNFLILSDS